MLFLNLDLKSSGIADYQIKTHGVKQGSICVLNNEKALCTL